MGGVVALVTGVVGLWLLSRRTLPERSLEAAGEAAPA
jgi:hypothetical protein